MKALLIDTERRRVECLYADSSIGRDAMPLFVPEGAWRGRVHLALRVGRLGKAVSEKFAERYIDVYAPVLILYKEDDLDGGVSGARGCYIDSAVTAGQWASVEDAAPVDVCDGIPLGTPEAAGHPAGTIATDDLGALARVCVPLVTSQATIKTGDILITDRHVDVGLTPDTYVRACGMLRVKIK